MPELTVRPASHRDLAALIALDELALPGSKRWDDLQELVTGAPGRILLAEKVEGIDSIVVGYLVMAPGHFFGRDFIELVVVAESQRRQGVATRLIAAALNGASTSAVFTSTNESNRGMRALLEGQGWTVSGVLSGLDQRDPEIVFYRETP